MTQSCSTKRHSSGSTVMKELVLEILVEANEEKNPDGGLFVVC